MKEKFQRLTVLESEIAGIQAELDPHVSKVAIQVAKARRPLERSGEEFPSEEKSIESWSVTGDTIFVKWEEYWSMGGHAEGSFDFPFVYVTDPDALTQYIAECEQKYLQMEEEEETAQRQRDEQQLIALQKKLNKA